MRVRQLERFVFVATGLLIAAALAIVLSGRYGPAPYAAAGLGALAWALVFAIACRRIGHGTRKSDRTAVVWTA